MPVRSLTSRVLRWPRPEVVDASVRRWAQVVGSSHPEVVRIGYFGSYARGDWGVGSDVDLLVIVTQSDQSFERRGLALHRPRLPVPSDLLVYTLVEWERMSLGPGFAATANREAVWVYPEE